MPLRVRSLWYVILWLSILPMALPAETEPPAQDLLGHIQRLDREVGERWRQARDQAARGLLSDATERRRLTEDTERQRSRLRLLEVRARRLPETERETFLDKLRLIGWVLEDLEKVASSAELPPRPSVDRSASGLEVRSTAAPLGANSCPDAPVIGYGTFSGTTVGATNDGSGSCGSSELSPDVWFRFVAPESRTVSADTFGSGFDTVLSMHTGCPGVGFTQVCNDDASGLQSAISFFALAGTTYWIRVSGFDGATGPFQLRVGPGGAMTGTVTREDNGLPVTSGRVRATSADGGFFPFSVSELLAPDGTYTLAGMEAGSYQVQTTNLADLQDEVWDDLPCTGRLLCDLENGDLVAVDSLGTTEGIDFALATGGAITGTAVRKTTGEPMEEVFIRVSAFPNGDVVATTETGADGSYLVSGLAEGSYMVEAVGVSGSDFAGQVYDGITCRNACSIIDATPVPVTAGATTSGIDFEIQARGVLEGTVTDSTTGLPIEDAFVEVIFEDSNFTAGTANTDATGAFRMTGFRPGTYFLSAQQTGYLTEAYEETPCPSFCSPSIGTPVPVDYDQVVTGLDFTLEPFGSISGTLTAAVGGAPVPDGLVGLDLGPGRFVKNAAVDVDGTYRFVNVRAGTYFVRTAVRDATDFLDELYDDIPCYVDCDFSRGTTVTVLPGTETSGIDFALDLGGTFTGTVTDSVTGLPLISGTVGVYTRFGFFLESTPILGDGSFIVSGLLPESYLLLADSPGYSGQIYDSVPCFGGLHNCDRLAGTPVEVGAGETVSGLDFALDPLGSISGRVTDGMTGAGVSAGSVNAVDLGRDFIGGADLNPDGTYTIDGVPSGRFFLLTSTDGFVDELYDDVECGSGCDFSDATLIAVEIGEAIAGVDFQLDRLGEITGTVVDADTGEPLGARVELFDEQGEEIGFDKFTDASGDYLWPDLVPGTYFVLASASNHLPEVYDDILCQGCSPTKGTPVVVVSGAETADIDFALEPFQAGLTGTVIATETGLPAAGVGIQVWDSGGNPLMRVVTDETGVWRAGLSPSTYFVSTDAEGVFLDQVYPGVSCEGACDPLLGTPLTVDGPNSVVREIDFFLETGPAIFSNGFESGDVSAWTRAVP